MNSNDYIHEDKLSYFLISPLNDLSIIPGMDDDIKRILENKNNLNIYQFTALFLSLHSENSKSLLSKSVDMLVNDYCIEKDKAQAISSSMLQKIDFMMPGFFDITLV
jgi:hypothetical protein